MKKFYVDLRVFGSNGIYLGRYNTTVEADSQDLAIEMAKTKLLEFFSCMANVNLVDCYEI